MCIVHRLHRFTGHFSDEPVLCGCRLIFSSIYSAGVLRPVKSWVLVCWWWFDWSFARLIAPDVTTTSIILCFNKHWLTSRFIVIQSFIQSASSFCSTSPNHLNLPFLITKLTGSSPNSYYPRRARSALGVDTILTLDVCMYVCMYVRALERKRLIGMTWNSEP